MRQLLAVKGGQNRTVINLWQPCGQNVLVKCIGSARSNICSKYNHIHNDSPAEVTLHMPCFIRDAYVGMYAWLRPSLQMCFLHPHCVILVKLTKSEARQGYAAASYPACPFSSFLFSSLSFKMQKRPFVLRVAQGLYVLNNTAPTCKVSCETTVWPLYTGFWPTLSFKQFSTVRRNVTVPANRPGGLYELHGHVLMCVCSTTSVCVCVCVCVCVFVLTTKGLCLMTNACAPQHSVHPNIEWLPSYRMFLVGLYLTDVSAKWKVCAGWRARPLKKVITRCDPTIEMI